MTLKPDDPIMLQIADDAAEVQGIVAQLRSYAAALPINGAVPVEVFLPLIERLAVLMGLSAKDRAN